MINMSEAARRFELPALPAVRWHLALDTGRASPTDIIDPSDQVAVDMTPFLLRSRSIVVLEGRGS